MANAKEILINHLENLRGISAKSHPAKQYTRFHTYYEGHQSNKVKTKSSKFYNIVKAIVDTKTTFVLDNHITTSVVPSIVRNADIDSIKSQRQIADILEDAKESVFEANNMNRLKEGVVKNGNITNVGIAKVNWDSEKSNGIGDVAITEVLAKNLFLDPTASDIQQGAYVFEETSYSPYALKRKYPHMSEEIDKLAGSSGKSIVDKMANTVKDITGVITAQSGTNTKQMFTYDTTGIKDIPNEITVYHAYLRDDTTYEDLEEEGGNEEIVAKVGELKFPNGRYVVYSGKDTIFEDREMDSPFFPFSIYYETNGNNVYSPGGLVDGITFIQDRINKAGERLQYLMGKFVSIIVLDGACGVNEQEILNQDTLVLNPNSLTEGKMPQILTSNTISEIRAVQDYIKELKNDAKEVSRINDMMMSGERKKGVTSGEMVDALNESPMTSIRQSQRNFMDFYIEMTNQVIFFIQKYYDQQRMIRTTTGERIVKIPLKEEGEQRPIEIFEEKEKENGQKTLELLEEIESSISDGEFHTDIIAGSELPRSKTQTAQITMDLASQGFFGDPNSIKSKERVLTALDFPNRRAIIDDMKADEAEALQADTSQNPLEFMKGMNVNFKDLENFPGAQAKLLEFMGLINVPGGELSEEAESEVIETDPEPIEGDLPPTLPFQSAA